MKSRPWIWLILGNLLLIAALTTMVVIACQHPPLEVPLPHGH